MHIVGICGPIDSGKTTFAELLVAADAEHRAHFESSTVVMELCNELDAALRSQPQPFDAITSTNAVMPTLLKTLSAYCGRTIKMSEIAIQPQDIPQNPIWYDKLFKYYANLSLNPTLLAHVITPENKSDYRALMQWVGGYFLYRINDSVMWYRELKNRISTLPPAITFVALTAPRQPAEADYIHAPLNGFVIMMKRPHRYTDSQEGTERRVTQIVPDITIINNGNLADLAKTARQVARDIEAGSFKGSYSAR